MALFEGLTSINPYTLKAEPGVAKRWHISEDGLIYTFFLRADARWSNGDPITAEDYRWSWQRELAPNGNKPYTLMLFVINNAREYHIGELQDFTKVGIKVLDASTLQVTLKNPTPYFLQLLANPGTFALHRPTVERYGEADALFKGWTQKEHFVNNGPFQLAHYAPDEAITVTKSATYWDKNNVKLNGIVFYHFPDAQAENKSYSLGQLHYTQTVPLSEIENYRNNNDPSYQQTLFLATYYYFFNTLRPPLDDIRVRKALSLSVDRDAINQRIYSNSMRAANSFTPPGINGYYPREIITYNPEKARILLAKAGFDEGKNWPVVKLSYNNTETNRLVASMVRDMWERELNVTVKLAPISRAEYTKVINTGSFDIGRLTWIGDYVDPNTFLEIFITDGAHNLTGFSNPRYDAIILYEAMAAKTPEERNELYTEAETLLMEDAPIVPIYNATSKHLIHASVQGVPPNIIDLINFKYISLKEASR